MEFTAEQAAILSRGRRLSIQVSTEGWSDILAISRRIVDEALEQMRGYKGTDVQETATLTFIWKTLDAHHLRLITSIQSAIDEAKALLNKPEDRPEKAAEEAQASGTVVKPLCDMELENV
jgi:hypothetical protein